MANTIDLTLYLVGDDADDAQTKMPFDSEESAQSYADDAGGNIYSVQAVMDFDTMQKIS